jgi:hypothetical protein
MGNHFELLRLNNPDPQGPIVLESAHPSLPLPYSSTLFGELVNTARDLRRIPLCASNISAEIHGQSLFMAYPIYRELVEKPGKYLSTVGWAEYDLASGAMLQSGQLPTDDENALLCPSLSTTIHGVLIGFTMTSAALYPTGSYAFRRHDMPLGQMAGPFAFREGEGPYDVHVPGTYLRTGDYSMTMEDPDDACHLWTIQQIGKTGVAASAWARIGICDSLEGPGTKALH